ncbi:Protein of unknown function [Peptoclostridium litorale DSM 5388]|uniref:DUF2922 domain-containing protein n=1 Tax=Peptoclostridium litorale DSM 5388 TaxID=1121324 RepID=A0A069RCZ7_PEPLI|nr:DUF2922 domain-containing protein [Peptoclostridium litorale]KDR94944.1 hypothetical protein CLIT_12c00120 [Peptoclostridium litorale DSM 5388]SIO33983.1 Protein of unknown function [Peptoclostridium litorale DSM 5388]
MDRIVEMSFVKSDGKKFTLRLDNAKENLAEAEVNGLMDLIVQKDVYSFDGATIAEKEGANLVTVQQTPFEMS